VDKLPQAAENEEDSSKGIRGWNRIGNWARLLNNEFAELGWARSPGGAMRYSEFSLGVVGFMSLRKQLAFYSLRAVIAFGLIIPTHFRASAENSGNGRMSLRANVSSSVHSENPGNLRAKEPDDSGGLVSLPGNPLWAIPLASLTATVERPIFAPSRRRPPENAPAKLLDEVASLPPAADEPPGPPLVLLGAIGNERKGIAIFRDQMTKEIIRLKLGDNHSGWTLRTVNRREALFNKGQKTSVLSIEIP
jgi:hypothetical protein